MKEIKYIHPEAGGTVYYVIQCAIRAAQAQVEDNKPVRVNFNVNGIELSAYSESYPTDILTIYQYKIATP